MCDGVKMVARGDSCSCTVPKQGSGIKRKDRSWFRPFKRCSWKVRCSSAVSEGVGEV